MRALFNLLLTTGLLLCTGLEAQTEKPLTNADVASMIKAGLPESTIVLAIDLASERGTTDFDTTPKALIELKKAGASENILNAMLSAHRPVPQYVPSNVVPGLPTTPGVYYRRGSEWAGLQLSVIWPQIKDRWRGVTVAEQRRYVLAGPHAPLQISESKPTFYVRGSPSEAQWQLVRLNHDNSTRVFEVSAGDVFALTRNMPFESAGLRSIDITALADDVFTIQPRAGLQAGEYVITKATPWQGWLLTGYAFGVVAEK